MKIFTSLFVGGICTWLVVKNMEWGAVWVHLASLSAGPVLLYLVTMAPTHFFRAARWNYLLRPIGVSLPLRRLLPISSVGFLAIMALPFRLGEFVRPYYLVREGRCRMSAALGTVAAERVVDGLIVSVILFTTYLTSRVQFGKPLAILGGAPLYYFAWLSLAVFVAATSFLTLALKWPRQTVQWSLRLSLLSWLAPGVAHKIGDKLDSLIQGFSALRQPANLVPVSFAAAYAMMAFTGVVISLPNSPGLVGQFQVGIVAVLAAYLDPQFAAQGGAYAIVVHALQVVWYLSAGVISLKFAGGQRSLRQMVVESKVAADDAEASAQMS